MKTKHAFSGRTTERKFYWLLLLAFCGPLTAQTLTIETLMLNGAALISPELTLPNTPQDTAKSDAETLLIHKRLGRQVRQLHYRPAPLEYSVYRKKSSPGQLSTIASPLSAFIGQENRRAVARPINLRAAFSAASRLQVSQLQGVWNSANNEWGISATITDPGNERLFKNLSDLSAMNDINLRQTPTRHFWLGLERRF